MFHQKQKIDPNLTGKPSQNGTHTIGLASASQQLIQVQNSDTSASKRLLRTK